MGKSLDREEFLRSLGRSGALLGMGLLGVAALRGSRSPGECVNTWQCAACRVYGDCRLPEKKKEVEKP